MSNDYDSVILNHWLLDHSQWMPGTLRTENQYPPNFQEPQSTHKHGTPLGIIGVDGAFSPSGGDCVKYRHESVLPPHLPPTFSPRAFEHLSTLRNQNVTVSYTIYPPQPQFGIQVPQFAHSMGYSMHNAQYQSPCEPSGSPGVGLWSPPIIHRNRNFYSPAINPRLHQPAGIQNIIETPHLNCFAAVDTWRPGNHMDSQLPFEHEDRNTSGESYGGYSGSLCRKYTSVRVILLHWEEDGNLPGCTHEVRQLELLFRDNFGYRTTSFSIPEQNSIDESMGCIERFFHCSRSDELLIVFYAGHATKEPFHLSSSPGSNITIPWAPIQSIIESSESDVLLFMDSCYAANSIPCRSAKILIGACDKDQKAAIPGEFSFTTRLLEALRTLSNNFQNGLSATALHIYISLMMKQLPNPWFAQESQIRLFAGSGDIWIERISNGLNLSLDYSPTRSFRKGRRGQNRYRGRRRHN